MFSRQPKESNKTENSELQDLLKSSVTDISEIEEEEIEPETKSELVSTVEKISSIVSPYFIALVGLLLYDENVLFGTVLIAVGIIALFKVTTKDINKLVNWFKNLMGNNE